MEGLLRFPPAIRARASGGASTQTRLMEPQITPPLSSRPLIHMHPLCRGYSSVCEVGRLPRELTLRIGCRRDIHICLQPLHYLILRFASGKWQYGKHPTAIFIRIKPKKKKTGKFIIPSQRTETGNIPCIKKSVFGYNFPRKTISVAIIHQWFCSGTASLVLAIMSH